MRWIGLVVPDPRLNRAEPAVEGRSVESEVARYEAVVRQQGWQKVRAILPGGRTRRESAAHGLRQLPAEAAWIALHDAARPLVSHALLERIFAAAYESGAAVPALPVADTIKRATQEGQVVHTLDRGELFTVQTPQVFRADWLREVYQTATEEASEPTDDATLLERKGYPVRLVPGDPTNVKLTTPEDLLYIQWLFERRQQEKDQAGRNRSKGSLAPIRVGIGYDIHSFMTGRRLVLGGVEIPYSKGLLGHSDADVVVHAICDALLGAAGLEDIGHHFPDTDPRWRDVRSLVLLKEVARFLAERGWQVVYVDTMILAQAPRLAPFLPAMRVQLAATLQVDPGQVNLKATTQEGLDAVGREEGIACYAVATIQRL